MRYFLCYIIFIFSLGTMPAIASQKLAVQIINNDSIFLSFLPEVKIYAPLKFKNKRQEKFYWKTVRDVKKTLPYAKKLSIAMQNADSILVQLPPKERRKWWKKYEKELFKTYEKDFRNMTASQGKMLMKLLDRETNKTAYQIIFFYKGKMTANFWQLVAKLFKNDLKEGYDANDKGQII